MGVSAFHRSLWPVIIRRYEAGEQIELIAEDLGIDRKTVYNVARRAGLPRRHVFDPARRERILTAHRAGERLIDIAAREGVHRSYVANLARRAGLPPRKGWQRRYPIDEHAFDQPDGVGWWLVGLLAADGHIGTRDKVIVLTQSERDIDVLHEFLRYVGCPDRPLIELRLSDEAAKRTPHRSRAFAARIHSERIRQRLENHGITTQKSKSLELGAEAATQPAVWLGLLDGDGSVSLGKEGRRRRVDFYGTPAVMQQCSDFWAGRVTFERVEKPTVRSHTGGLANVSLHGPSASQAAQILLASSPISLKRKRRTLEDIAALDPT